MKLANVLIVINIALVIPAISPAQVAGSTLVGVAAAEFREVALGWSVKHQILGQSIYNDKNEAVGKVDDIIVGPDRAVAYAIVGAGGFLGVGKHDVVVPMSQLKLVDVKLVWAGATKDALMAMPPFEYAR